MLILLMILQLAVDTAASASNLSSDFLSMEIEKWSVSATRTEAIVEPPRRPPTSSKITDKTQKACHDYDESDDCWIRGQGLGDENH
jgi:hypothetical protein